MKVKILGSAAGGGFPQWNCSCSNCAPLRAGTLKSSPRTQTQVAVTSGGRQWHLLNASPDLRTQLLNTKDLWPGASGRNTPIASVILTSADVDSVLGLLHLREFQPFRVYCTSAVRRIVREENSIFRVLERVLPQVEWVNLPLCERVTLSPANPQVPGSSLAVMAVGSSGSYPDYVSPSLRKSLSPGEAVSGLVIEEGQNRLFFAPSFPLGEHDWQDHVRMSCLALLDGTFWSDDELAQIRRSSPTARQMGHLPLSGKDGMLELFPNTTRTRRVLIHINNTNPILDEDSPEYHQVREAGWEVARDGMEFTL